MDIKYEVAAGGVYVNKLDRRYNFPDIAEGRTLNMK